LLTWTERILSLPVRTAAVAEFLRDLSAKGWGDLNGVLATFNDGELSRDALGYWLERGWIVRAPSSALSALTGPAFSRELTLQEFCGQEGEDWDELGRRRGRRGHGLLPAPSRRRSGGSGR
jgi:hypothetical protein